MNARSKLIAFATVLAGATVVGSLLEPRAPGGQAPANPQTGRHEGGLAMTESSAKKTDKRDGAGGQGSMSAMVRGMAIAQDGVRLAIEMPELCKSHARDLRLGIAGDRNRAVRDFAVEQTQPTHRMVMRDHLTGFPDLHPTLDAGGPWVTHL